MRKLLQNLAKLSLTEKLLLTLAAVAVVVGIVARFVHLGWPDSKVFDEVYFPDFAWKYLHGEQAFDVHPPLGKFIIALGLAVFGNDPFGWRIMPAVFGVAAIFLFAKIWRDFQGERIGSWLLAAFIATDGLLLAYSRTGLMDGILFTCTFACFWLALRAKEGRNLFWLATLIGLTVAIKWLALGIVLPVGYLLWRRGRLMDFWGSLYWSFFVYLLIVFLGRVVGHQPNPWLGIYTWHSQALGYHLNLTATHPWGSPWWSWPLLKRPVLFYYTQTSTAAQVITAMGNPLLWWSSTVAVLLATLEMIQKGWQRQKGLLDHPLVPLLLGYYTFLLPWALVHRVLFLYHYLPAYGFALLILTYYLVELWKRQPWLVILFLLVTTACSFYFLPWALGSPLSFSWLKAHIWVNSWLY